MRQRAARELSLDVAIETHNADQCGVDFFDVLVNVFARFGWRCREKLLNVIGIDKVRFETFEKSALKRQQVLYAFDRIAGVYRVVIKLGLVRKCAHYPPEFAVDAL